MCVTIILADSVCFNNPFSRRHSCPHQGRKNGIHETMLYLLLHVLVKETTLYSLRTWPLAVIFHSTHCAFSVL